MKITDNNLNIFIRPGILIYSMLIFTILVFWDSSSDTFNVRDIYIKILESIIVASVVSYFTSRGVEKVFKIKEYKDNDKKEKQDGD